VRSLDESEEHYRLCPKSFMKCVNCPETYLRSELNLHEQDCIGFIEKCTYCKLEMKRCELDEHVRNDCLESEIQCLLCNDENVKRKDINHHIESICLENNI